MGPDAFWRTYGCVESADEAATNFTVNQFEPEGF